MMIHGLTLPFNRQAPAQDNTTTSQNQLLPLGVLMNKPPLSCILTV